MVALPVEQYSHEERTLVGVDVFIYDREKTERFIKKMRAISTSSLSLAMVSNRGARIWPEGHPETFCIQQWRCRYMPKSKGNLTTQEDVLALLHALANAGCDIIKTENLYDFDHKPGY